jgi:TPR repeat protein
MKQILPKVFQTANLSVTILVLLASAAIQQDAYGDETKGALPEFFGVYVKLLDGKLTEILPVQRQTMKNMMGLGDVVACYVTDPPVVSVQASSVEGFYIYGEYNMDDMFLSGYIPPAQADDAEVKEAAQNNPVFAQGFWDTQRGWSLGRNFRYVQVKPNLYWVEPREGLDFSSISSQYNVVGLAFGNPNSPKGSVCYPFRFTSSPATDRSQLEEAAEQGDAEAQCKLGVMYANGQGVTQDYGKALEWYRKSAEQGNSEAQYKLGVMYVKGRGVAQDYGKALEWYRKSAEQGNAAAQFALGGMYVLGEVVPQDYHEAIEWYKKSADQDNNAVVQYNLGVMYAKGQGVAQDYGKALEWYRKSAEQKYAGAQSALGAMYVSGQGVPQDYGKAVEWYHKSAEQGDVEAQCYLGFMYAKGQGVAQDYGKALEWYRRSAEQGNAAAQSALGAMYVSGQGVPQDYGTALEWHRKSAEQRYAGAQSALGAMYAQGLGVPQDYATAVEWLRKAAEQRYTAAQSALGAMYAEGLGVPQDYAMAVEWLRKAAEQGNVSSLNGLAWLYATCPNTSFRDPKKALEFALEALAKEGGKSEDSNNYTLLDTLAAAYARNDDFAKAIETQEKVVALLGTAKELPADAKRKLLEGAESRLKLYKTNTAYVDDGNAGLRR